MCFLDYTIRFQNNYKKFTKWKPCPVQTRPSWNNPALLFYFCLVAIGHLRLSNTISIFFYAKMSSFCIMPSHRLSHKPICHFTITSFHRQRWPQWQLLSFRFIFHATSMQCDFSLILWWMTFRGHLRLWKCVLKKYYNLLNRTPRLGGLVILLYKATISVKH